MSDVQIRDWRAEDESDVLALWLRVFGRPKGGQTPSWLFRDGPGGPPVRAVGELDGRIVALAGVMPLRFRLGGEAVRGGYSVGAMTAPEVQGRGIYVRIGTFLYERLEALGFAFVAGFSNANSHRLMTGPLGRTPIQPFPWCVRPLLPMPVAWLRSGPGQDGDVPRTAIDDPAFDAVWARVAPTVRVGAVRDAAFASWRFATRPDAGYVAWRADGPSGAEGVLVLRVLTVRGLRVGFVVELLVDPGARGAGRRLLQAAARHTRATGGVALSALMPASGPMREALRRFGFVRVPEPLHPQVIRLSVRGLGRYADEQELRDPRAWLLSWADTDVV